MPRLIACPSDSYDFGSNGEWSGQKLANLMAVVFVDTAYTRNRLDGWTDNLHHAQKFWSVTIQVAFDY